MTAIQQALTNDKEEIYQESDPEKLRPYDQVGTLKLVPMYDGKIIELPAEDDIPMESHWHRTEMNLLIDSLHQHWRDRSDYFTGGNMFIYFSLQQVKNEDYRGPDFFVVKDTDGTRYRHSWIVWEENGKYPDVIVELASPSTIDTDLGLKKELYEQVFRTREYFCYDPETEQLFGWELGRKKYEEIKPDSQGRLPSRELGVRLGKWEGEYLRTKRLWLRFYNDEGQLVLTQAEAKGQKAQAESQRAETESQRAKAEARRAEIEARRAKAEAQKAKAEAQRAQAAEAELERLRALLSQQGLL